MIVKRSPVKRTVDRRIALTACGVQWKADMISEGDVTIEVCAGKSGDGGSDSRRDCRGSRQMALAVMMNIVSDHRRVTSPVFAVAQINSR